MAGRPPQPLAPRLDAPPRQAHPAAAGAGGLAGGLAGLGPYGIAIWAMTKASIALVATGAMLLKLA